MRWEHGSHVARMDDEGITFDMRGTPLDMEWWCALDRLADKVDVLRQTWPEAMLAEIFAEAARRRPGVAAVPPPPRPAAPAALPAVKPSGRRRRRRSGRAGAVAAPSPVAGFGAETLERLCARLVDAARALDPALPRSLGPLETDGRDISDDLRTQVETRRTRGGAFAIVVRLELEVQDGIGGPVAREVAASFACQGLPAGLALTATWDGRTLEPRIVAAAELVERCERELRRPIT
jgi:hypothetical protein